MANPYDWSLVEYLCLNHTTDEAAAVIDRTRETDSFHIFYKRTVPVSHQRSTAIARQLRTFAEEQFGKNAQETLDGFFENDEAIPHKDSELLTKIFLKYVSRLMHKGEIPIDMTFCFLNNRKQGELGIRELSTLFATEGVDGSEMIARGFDLAQAYLKLGLSGGVGQSAWYMMMGEEKDGLRNVKLVLPVTTFGRPTGGSNAPYDLISEFAA